MLVGEKESSPLLELFRKSQGSRLLVRNAFCKGWKSLLLIWKWQEKELFFSLTGYLCEFQEIWIYRWIFCFVQNSRETPQISDLKLVWEQKEHSSDSTEATCNTAGPPWALKVLSGKRSSYCNLGLLAIIRSFPCCVLDFKEKLVDGLICESRKRKSFLLCWVKNKWGFTFLLCLLTYVHKEYC